MVRKSNNKVYYDENYSVSDLRYILKKEGFTGYSRLNKTELLQFVNRYFNDKRICNNHLSKQIAKNVRKFNNHEEFISRKQAIAVAYSQVREKYNMCNIVYE